MIFLARAGEAAVDLVRVEITTEVSPTLPGLVALAQERHLLRWRALQVRGHMYLHLHPHM